MGWAIGLRRSVRAGPGRYLWSGPTASASPGMCSAADDATAGRSCGKPSSASPTRAATCLYLRQEGRGIGLYAKLEAYALQDTGLDTYEANLALGHREDERSYLVAAQMLTALGVTDIALLSNNPDKARQLRRFGVAVTSLCADRRSPVTRQRPLSGDKGAEGRPHARRSAIGRVRSGGRRGRR